MTISEMIEDLKSENIRLKWVIAQLMQRYGKESVLLHMDNDAVFGILVKEDFKQRLVDVRVKRVEKPGDEFTDADGPVNLN